MDLDDYNQWGSTCAYDEGAMMPNLPTINEEQLQREAVHTAAQLVAPPEVDLLPEEMRAGRRGGGSSKDEEGPSDLTALLSMMESPFPKVEKWQPFIKRVIAYTLPADVFEPAPQLWSHFKSTPKGQAHARLHYSMAHILQRADMGTFSVDKQKHHWFVLGEERLPKVVPTFESLTSLSGQWLGVRVILFVLDPQWNLAVGFKKMMETNREVQKMMRSVGGRLRPSSVKLFRDIVDTATYTTLLANYFIDHDTHGGINNGGHQDMDELHQDHNDITDERSMLNPVNIFTLESAFVQTPTNVQITQRTLGNYVEPGRMNIFKPFPLPDLVSRLHSKFFSCEVLAKLPLPQVLYEYFFKVVNQHRADMLASRQQCYKLEEQMKEFGQRVCGRTEHGMEPLLQEIRNRLKPYSASMARTMMSAEHYDELVKLVEQHAQEYETVTRLHDAVYRAGHTNMDRLRGFIDSSRGSTNELLSGTKLEAFFGRVNDFIKLRLHNDYRLTQMLTELGHDKDVFMAAQHELRQNGLEECWRVFMESDKVTGAVKAARSWWKTDPLMQSPAGHFHSAKMRHKNLTLFGNAIISLLTDLDVVKRIRTEFRTAILILANVWATCRYSHHKNAKDTIKPNVLLTGVAGIGKSYLMKVISELTIPGTTCGATYFTKKAFTGSMEEDNSDVHFLMEETPLWVLGRDEQGREIPQDNVLKDKMSQQQSIIVTPHTGDDGKRRTIFQYSRLGGNGTFACNAALAGGRDSALYGRFLCIQSRKRVNYTVDPMKDLLKEFTTQDPDTEFSEASANVETSVHDDAERRTSHVWKLIQFYIMFWEQCIAANVMPEIDCTIVDIVCSQVFAYLKSLGFDDPIERHVLMCKEFCRIFTMFFAIYACFFSELGHARREGPPPMYKPRPFEPKMMLDLIPWGVCRQEIVIFVLSLMENIWIPYLNLEIGTVHGRKMAPYDQKLKAYTATYNSETKSLDMPKCNTKGLGFRRIKTKGRGGGPPVTTYDLSYIEFSESRENQFYHDWLYNHMTHKPCITDIRQALSDMDKKGYISSPEMEFVDPLIYDYDRAVYKLETLEKQLQLQKKKEESVTNDIDLAKERYANFDSLMEAYMDLNTDRRDGGAEDIEYDGTESSIECISDLEDTLAKIKAEITRIKSDINQTQARINEEKEKPAVKAIIDWRAASPDNAKLSSGLIPPPPHGPGSEVKILRDKIGSTPKMIKWMHRTGGKKPGMKTNRYAIAVKAFDIDIDNVMAHAFRVLEHRYQPTRTILMAINKVVTQPDHTIDTLYNVFTTITLTPRPKRVLLVKNNLAITPEQQAYYKEAFGLNIPDAESRRLHVINADPEDVLFEHYWDQVGAMDPYECYTATPSHTMDVVLEVRKDPRYAQSNAMMVAKYPDDIVRAILKEREQGRKRKDMKSRMDCIAHGTDRFTDLRDAHIPAPETARKMARIRQQRSILSSTAVRQEISRRRMQSMSIVSGIGGLGSHLPMDEVAADEPRRPIISEDMRSYFNPHNLV